MADKQHDAILAVPTNVITGFLGTGKTTAILHLLQQKPENERWAILVNEFGEIGVDGSLFGGNHSAKQNVFIREVPGGCMCCAAGLPMQIALNQLLNQAKPDRLFIEPTGLGHPEEVMRVLSAGYYKNVLDIQKIVTLVDARQLQDARYTQHDTFNQQIALADILVGNKRDLYKAQDESALKAYAALHTKSEAQVKFTQQGKLSSSWLEGKSQFNASANNEHHHHLAEISAAAADVSIPEQGYIEANNQGEGFESIGWRFSAEQVFDRSKLRDFVRQVDAVRLKAVFITQEGIFGFNATTDDVSEFELDDCIESRIEIIAPKVDPTWKHQLLACRSFS